MLLRIVVDAARILDVVVHAGAGSQLVTAPIHRPKGSGQNLFEVRELFVNVDVTVAAESICLGMSSVDDPISLRLRRPDNLGLGHQALLFGDTVGNRLVVGAVCRVDGASGFRASSAGDRLKLPCSRLCQPSSFLGRVVDQCLSVCTRLADHPIGLRLGFGQDPVGLGARMRHHVRRLGRRIVDGLVGQVAGITDEGIALVENILRIVEFAGDRILDVVKKSEHISARHDAASRHRKASRLLDDSDKFVQSFKYAVHSYPNLAM